MTSNAQCPKCGGSCGAQLRLFDDKGNAVGSSVPICLDCGFEVGVRGKRHLQKALELIEEEYIRAEQAYGDFYSLHEGYAILKEEMDELWDEIKRKDYNWDRMEREASQVGAMAIRLLVDCIIPRRYRR